MPSPWPTTYGSLAQGSQPASDFDGCFNVSVICAQTLTALKALAKPDVPQIALLASRASLGDGGWAIYWWNSADVSAGNDFTIVQPAAGGNGRWNMLQPSLQWAVAGGTADVITGAFTPAITLLYDGLIVGVRASGSNATTTPTFQADATTAHTITKTGGAALAVGDIPGNLAETLLRYNLANTRWELLNPAAAGAPIGTMIPWAGIALPTSGGTWDWMDGGTLLRTTYSTLKSVLMKESTVTISIASPAVVTWTAHGLRTNTPVKFFTTGALPTGITAGTHGYNVGTWYYVNVIDANTFNISATPGGANVNTSGSQSGTQTATAAPYGDGDGSTTFHKPDMRGRIPAGRDDMGGSAANRITSSGSGINGNVMGANGGAETTTLSTAQLASHQHGIPTTSQNSTGGPNVAQAGFTADGPTLTTNNAGSGSAHLNTQPSLIGDWIIRIA